MLDTSPIAAEDIVELATAWAKSSDADAHISQPQVLASMAAWRESLPDPGETGASPAKLCPNVPDRD